MKSWVIAALSSFGFHSVVAASVLTGNTGTSFGATSAPIEFTLALPEELEPQLVEEEASPEPAYDPAQVKEQEPIPAPAIKSTAPQQTSTRQRDTRQTATKQPPLNPSSPTPSNPSEAPLRTGITMSNQPDGGTQNEAKGTSKRSVPSAKAVDTGHGNCGESVQKPKPLLRKTPIPYPAHLQSQNIEGRLVLRAHISEDGSVVRVEILAPVHPSLDKLAAEAVRTWTFRPATRCGKPVAGGTYTMARRFVLGAR